ncbi:hypothetical protein CVS40_8965 [Lucilia cuprina]|nr:hypothetical protein CVS40_8965 [Lucilia cuprina]
MNLKILEKTKKLKSKKYLNKIHHTLKIIIFFFVLVNKFSKRKTFDCLLLPIADKIHTYIQTFLIFYSINIKTLSNVARRRRTDRNNKYPNFVKQQNISPNKFKKQTPQPQIKTFLTSDQTCAINNDLWCWCRRKKKIIKKMYIKNLKICEKNFKTKKYKNLNKTKIFEVLFLILPLKYIFLNKYKFTKQIPQQKKYY